MATQLQPAPSQISLLNQLERSLVVDRQQSILGLAQQIEDQLVQLEQFIRLHGKSPQSDPEVDLPAMTILRNISGGPQD